MFVGFSGHGNSIYQKIYCLPVDFAILVDRGVKIKENEKTDKFSGFSRDLKKLLNMKVTVIPIVVGARGMVPKRQEKRSEEES